MWAGPLIFIATIICWSPSPLWASSLEFSFEHEPISRLVKPDDGRALFRCISSNPSAEVRWLYKGQPAPQNRWIKVSGEKLSAHFGKIERNSRPPTFLEDAYFQCELRLKGRVLVSAPANLIFAVLEQFPVQADVHIATILGHTAVIPCDPPFSVPTAITEFLFNETIINKSTDKVHLMASGDLQIFNASYEDTGEYICVANNPFLAEKVTSKRKVILHIEEPSHRKSPSFVRSPRSKITTVFGSNITLECVADGYPVPKVSWRKHHGSLPKGRHEQIGGNLNLIGVKKDDEGIYYCDADNSVGSVVTATTTIEVQETPQIVKISKSAFVETGSNVTLNCATRGHPKPSLTWIHNGQTLHTHSENKIRVSGSHLTLQNVTRKESGIYQCFASNELGTVYDTTSMFVLSKNKTSTEHDSSDIDYDSDEDFRRPPKHRNKDKSTTSAKHNSKNRKKSHQDHDADVIVKRPHKRKKHKRVKLIPPSKPDISRLSNTSVMVRWSVPRNDGLPVVFFKIQYKEIGTSNTEWMTIDEDIAAHIHSYAVTGLLSGVKYRFRIAAVYSNNDNKSGPISAAFILSKDPPMEKPSNGPTIVFAEPESPSAITLKWKYEDVDSVSIDGFFIHYRASHTAGKYLKVTVLGANTRSHIISHLLPDTGYDVKMQCFNIAGTSEFSNIITAKTKVAETVPGIRNRNGKMHHPDDMAVSLTEHVPSKNSNDSFILYVVLGIIAGALFVTSIVYAALFFRQKRNRENCDNGNDEEDDPLKLGNGHISGNGYIAVGNKVNISVNPLSQIELDDGEKIEDLEDIVSNNNEIIRLQTFSINVEPESEPLTNGADVDESNFNEEEKSAVILSGNFGSSTGLPENTE